MTTYDDTISLRDIAEITPDLSTARLVVALANGELTRDEDGRISRRAFDAWYLCSCGKPASHLEADEDSTEWSCRVPAANPDRDQDSE